jgi:hypothetical protein
MGKCNAIYGLGDDVKVTAFGQVTQCAFMDDASESFSASIFKVEVCFSCPADEGNNLPL